MNTRLAVVLSIVVIVVLAGGFLVAMQQGATTSTNSSSATSSTESQSATAVVTGGSDTNASVNLELQLSVNASFAGGSSGGVAIRITADDYNTLASANNVTVGRLWKLNGLSLSSCGVGAYPLGVALYRGLYTALNASAATSLQIYPITACPALLRLVTAYVLRPTSDLAIILPGGPNNAATPMSANVTAATEYASGVTLSSTPLGPGPAPWPRATSGARSCYSTSRLAPAHPPPSRGLARSGRWQPASASGP